MSRRSNICKIAPIAFLYSNRRSSFAFEVSNHVLASHNEGGFKLLFLSIALLEEVLAEKAATKEEPNM